MPVTIPKPFKGLQAGLIELLKHTIMVLAILLSIRVIELSVRYLWGHDKLLFGKFPLAYVFDGADLALIGCFLTFGIYRVIVSYYRSDKENVF